jgi:hypothetical protein
VKTSGLTPVELAGVVELVLTDQFSVCLIGWKLKILKAKILAL